MKAGKILMGILTGAAAGAAVGMLFAPRKGTETRRQLADKGNEYMNGTKSRFNDFTGNLSNKYDSVKTRVKGKTRKMETSMDGDDKIIY